MFGLLNFRKVIFALLAGFFWIILPASAGATGKNNSGKIITEGALVYKDPNFDAPVIAELHQGETYEISHKLFNTAFFKIRLKNNQIGYLADNDIKPSQAPVAETVPKQTSKKAPKAVQADDEDSSEKTNIPKKKKRSAQSKIKKKHPFVNTDYRGLAYEYMHYKENTLGGHPTDNLSFFGLKLSGPDLLIVGDIPMDVDILFHYGAPAYYQSATGASASGFIFLTDFLLLQQKPQGKDGMLFYGFGPMLKYSHYDVALLNAPYALDDMSVGVVFNFGGAVRFDSFALRAQAKYYWEKNTYYSLGLALQFPF